MKTVLRILSVLFLVVFSVIETQAQDRVFTASANWVTVSSAPLVATTTTNASVNHTAAMNTMFEKVKYQLVTTTVSGTTLAKAVFYYSFDYQNWTKVDSVTCSGAGASTPSSIQTINAPYVKWTITAYTNAQSTNWKLYVTGIKP